MSVDKPKRIAFFTNQICLQGTEVALYDYAHFNEVLWGNKSIVISKKNKIRERGGAKRNQPRALQKFRDRFELILLKDASDLDKVLEEKKIDILYVIKKGPRDGVESKKVKTCIHVVFKYYEPHGDVYAYVSKWLSEEMTGGKAPYVPHMIHLPKVDGDLREELGIPREAIVFGRYGGTDSFDVPFVHDAIVECVNRHENVYFIFFHTDDFLNKSKGLLGKVRKHLFKKSHDRIMFMPGTASLDRKSRFINTCTAMLHARRRGETFGVAIGEFSMHNVPVITNDGSDDPDFESCHLEILGDKCFKYKNKEELMAIFEKIIQNPDDLKKKKWDAYSAEYSPGVVMKKFKEVFF